MNYYANLQSAYQKNEAEIKRLNDIISSPDSYCDDQIKQYTDFLAKARNFILEESDESKAFIIANSFPPQTSIDTACNSAQCILNLEWKKAEDQQRRREELLKDCRDQNNKILFYNEQIEPIEGQTIENIRNIMSSNRELKRKYLRLEVEDLSNSADFCGKYLAISARAANEESRATTLSGNLIVNEAKVRALYLKHLLLTCPMTDQGIVAEQIKVNMQQINSLFPEPPNFQAYQQNYQSLDAFLSSYREKLIGNIKSTILSYKTYDRTYAGSLGVNDRMKVGCEELSYKVMMNKLELRGIQGDFDELDRIVSEKKDKVLNLSQEIKKLENEIRSKIDIDRMDPQQIAQQLEYEKQRKNSIEQKKNANIDQVKACNDFIAPMIEFETKANVPQAFRESLSQLQGTIKEFTRNQSARDYEMYRKPKDQECLEFVKQLGNNKYTNAELIKFYDSEHFILEKENKNYSTLFVKNGSPSYLTEAILNKYNEDPNFNFIIISLLATSEDCNLKNHFESLIKFCEDAEYDPDSTINFEDKDVNHYIPRQFPPPFFNLFEATAVKDCFIKYVSDWIKLYPNGILFQRDLIEKIINFFGNYKESQDATEILKTLKIASANEYKEGSKRLNKTPLPEKCSDAFIAGQYFITAFWEEYMNITLRDCLEFCQELFDDPSKLKDKNNNRVIIPTTQNENLQNFHKIKENLTKFILTQIFYDKKGEVALQWVKTTLDAYNNDNYEFYTIVYKILASIGSTFPAYKNNQLIVFYNDLMATKNDVKDRQKTENKLPYHKDFMQKLTEVVSEMKDQIRKMSDMEKIRLVINYIVSYLQPQQIVSPTIYNVDKKRVEKIFSSLCPKDQIISKVDTFLNKKGK